MSEWLQTQVREIRTRLAPEDEGALWGLFFVHPADEPVAMAIDAFTDDCDAELVKNLAFVVNGVGPVTLLWRHSGDREDRCLSICCCGREVAPLIDPHVDLVDLVVVGADTFWSARSGEESIPAVG